jgi:NADPH:quinone reductase-like Zn-dependent oxidoreductase
MTRRVFIPRHGGPDVLEVRETQPEPLAPGSVRIQVQATGVNFADLMMRMGLYKDAPPCPFVPGYEVAGTVTEIEGTPPDLRQGVQVGSSVMAATYFGGYSEEVVVPAAKVAAIPSGWSMEDAAAFLVGSLTAWTGLVPMARVQEGDRVLVHGIAGGLGLAAAQIAASYGAQVAGTCGGPKKVNRVQELGFEAFDYNESNPAAGIRAWAPGGVDIIMEARGFKALRNDLKLLRPAGRIVAYGVSAMVPGQKKNWFRVLNDSLSLLSFHVPKLVDANAGIFGLNLLKLWNEDGLLTRALDDMLPMVKKGTLRPIVDRAFPLEDAAGAHRYIHDRKNIGKIVLTTANRNGERS